MKNLKALVVVLGAAAAGGGGLAALMAGCSNNSGGGGPTPEAGSDSPVDSTIDVTPDTSPPPPDSSADTTAPDADAGPEGDAEAGLDASQIFQFPGRVSQAWCQRLQTCCAPADAGFDFSLCVLSTLAIGGANGDGLGLYNGRIPNNGGAIMFNTAMAQTCLQDISTIPCGMITTQVALQIRSDCYGALVGTIPVGSAGCSTNLDCAQGYCNIVGDAGTGTCTALVADGGACTFNEQCSYRGSGQPAQFCNTGAATPTCVPQTAIGGMCGFTTYYNQECTTEICAPPANCAAQGVFADPGVDGGTCASLVPVPQDAGGGG
jgi:hypothetical protein